MDALDLTQASKRYAIYMHEIRSRLMLVGKSGAALQAGRQRQLQVALRRSVAVLDRGPRLLDRFGPLHWWPADSPFEVVIGAILTQNTAWRNVEYAIANLRGAEVLEPEPLLRLPLEELERLIRPAGFYIL